MTGWEGVAVAPLARIDLTHWVEIHTEFEAATSEPASLSKHIEDLEQFFQTFEPRPERWPVKRTGEREPIPWPLRYAVALRDSFSCRHCHRPAFHDIEIDHIVPWSAGGSDRSTNLRVLCRSCNRERSNRRDATEAWRPLPVTYWCSVCWHEDSPARGLDSYGHDLNIAHRVQEELVTAFCATCRASRHTDVTL